MPEMSAKEIAVLVELKKNGLSVYDLAHYVVKLCGEVERLEGEVMELRNITIPAIQ